VLTVPLVRLFPGAVISATVDGLTALVTALVVDNPTARPVTVLFTVADRSTVQIVPAGQVGVAILPPGGQPPTLGENVSIVGVV
jgi:hypothetical protein